MILDASGLAVVLGLGCGRGRGRGRGRRVGFDVLGAKGKNFRLFYVVFEKTF